MNYAELSDLEEGEILECDIVLPSDSRHENFDSESGSFELLLKSRVKEDNDLSWPEQRNDGYMNRRLKEKLNMNKRSQDNKSIISMADLESISSEDDEDRKYSADEHYYYMGSNEIKKEKVRHLPQFYGTVEDIMSEIGETICRKSHCNYKKRKSKELKQNFDKCSESGYDVWRHKVFSSHLKSKKPRRNSSLGDSGSDLAKERTEKRKRRKRRDHEEKEKVTKKQKLRDFDEMRRSLLEKLKKQKAEEELKASGNVPSSEQENSEIQMVDMMIDCTNYVDSPPEKVPEYSTKEEIEGEDESDLVRLRLLALASNKKRKNAEIATKTEEVEDALAQEKSEACRKEVDLDRHELLLRAEALKTALLKKHQRRLNKMKVEKFENFSEKNAQPSPSEKDTIYVNLEKDNEKKFDADSCKENRKETSETGVASCSEVFSDGLFLSEMKETKLNGTVLLSNVNSKKIHPRVKCKRKKKKPGISTNSLKENEKNETLEEDDRMLRTQLLSDLMKKKCLKDQEKKSVLMDSSQVAVNKSSLSVVRAELPKESVKPLTTVKKNFLKKINVAKDTKPACASTFPKAEIQRIIVHLGSEDSSDDEAAPFPSVFPQSGTSPQEKAGESKRSAAAGSSDVNREPEKVIQANYEKSVEMLLSQAREKVEGKKRTATSTFATPEAVYKHLPPSQRLEYIRLKQKIAERESQRNRKMENASNSVVVSSGPQSPDNSAPKTKESVEKVVQKPKAANVAVEDSKPSNPNVPKPTQISTANSGVGLAGQSRVKPMKMNSGSVANSFGKSLKNCVMPRENGLKIATAPERNLLLLPSSQALISKLKLLLRKIKIEKTIQENYEKEISKLKTQLSIFEKRKCEQKFKIKKLWEESMRTYKAVQGITATSKEKKDENKERAADEEKKPKEDEGKKVSDEPETETSKAQSMCEKEIDTDGKDSETASAGASGPCLLKYDSPLQAFNKASDSSKRVDPNVTVCQFDLMGVCKDEECSYQHLRISAKL